MPDSIIHLSDTDINNDSRILKEMNSLKEFCLINDLNLYGIGLEEADQKNKKNNTNNKKRI